MGTVITTQDGDSERIYWNGYEIPSVRSGIKDGVEWRDGREPLCNKETGEVELECWEIPLEIIKFKKIKRKEYVTCYNFIVEILGNDYGVSKVEFPTLDPMGCFTDIPEEIALVKIYRCKLEGEG